LRRIDTKRFVRATRSTSRDINRRIILNLVRENEPISRAELARQMGIGRGMITSLVAELLDSGEIYSGSTVAAPRGRRPEMLFVRTRDRLVVAIDVRLSQTYVRLSDFGGRPRSFQSFETLADPAALTNALAGRIGEMLDESGARDLCEGIGLVVPGMVDHEMGRVLRAPQLGWRDVDIRDSLSQATGLPVTIDNAPIACALARMWLSDGDTKAPQNFVYMTVSDGVGTGIVSRGEVLRGASNTAGEFGHLALSESGPECLCGAYGCLEAYTSNLATLARYAGERFSPEVARRLGRSSEVTIADVIARWKSGEERATHALEATARHLGEGIAAIVTAVNPEVVFVGGEITEAWDLFAPYVAMAIERRALTPSAARTPVIPEAPGTQPRLNGATALVAARAFAAPVIA
jgi:N-acetylglucosamine repressor